MLMIGDVCVIEHVEEELVVDFVVVGDFGVVLLWYTVVCVRVDVFFFFFSLFFVFFFCLFFYFFFFQAEDGIRDIGVTGVQTCALPI